MFSDVRVMRQRPFPLAILIIVATIAADLSFRWRPTGYFGGTTDDQRYVEAALAWLIHGPHAGTTHWSLRHPLVLAVAGSFKTFGISLASLDLVPRLAGDLLVALTTGFVAQIAGRRAAILWVLLALASPILHEMATSCFPEMLELTFGAASMWLFWSGRAERRWSGAMLAGSGATLALAILTRETAVCLLPLYAYTWWRDGRSYRGALWFIGGLAPLIALDTGWLWSVTGDPLYRLHIDQSHIGIFSDHLRGGVYHGRAFLNPDLASRWVSSGPIDVHWTINPLIDFIVDPRFGLVFAAWAMLWLARSTRPPTGTLARIAMPALFAVAIASYLIVTWVLTLRPQPRYYLFAVYAATIALALIASRPARDRAANRLRIAAVALVLICGITTISLSPNRQRDAQVILPWLKAHPGVVLHLEMKEASRLSFPAILNNVRQQVSAASPMIGELRLTMPRSPGATIAVDPRGWQLVETLTEPRRFPYINPPRRLIIERRVR